MISQKAKYALKALLALSEHSPMQISAIAAERRIPKKFLEQILLELKHHGIVASRRGKKGGYDLLKSPESVTLGQVLRLVDGPLAPLPCLSRMAYQRCEDCEDETSCAIRRAFAEAYHASTAILERTSLADALARSVDSRAAE